MIWLRIPLAFLYFELNYAFDPIVHWNNTQFTWMTGRWESCISDHCGDGGRQLRQIWCVRERGEADLSSKCDPQHKPAEVRSCFKVCDEHRDLLEWRPEPWQACEPLNDESSTSPDCNILGTRLRNITCRWKETGKILDESLCSYFTPQPNIKEVCKVPCQQECIVTEYGSWSKCSKCGHRVRLRNVIVAPSPEMEPCLPLSEIEFCGPNTCLENIAHNYSLYLSTWGYCSPLKPVDYHEAEDYVHKAIIGVQKRNISCKNGEGINVDMQHCLQNNKISPSLEEVCVVLQKCQTSMWSPWQVINETCSTSDGQIRNGYVRRTRQVTHLPLGDGQACPHLEELEVMVPKGPFPKCTKYKWRPSEWTTCTSSSSGEEFVCGGGIQYRNVTCMRASDNIPVSDDLCSDLRPTISQQCHVSCPIDCTVSSWSPWSHCQPDHCDKATKHKGFRRRSRAVLQDPSSDGKMCPHLMEVQSCDAAVCYHWHMEEFGSCHTFTSNQSCGPGRRRRIVYCVNLRSDAVSEHLCPGNVPFIEESCHIPCPNDCVLSDWEAWSPCSEPCRNKERSGFQIRNRTVLANPGPGGKPCPGKSELMQKQECNQHSCTYYNWHLFPWQQCQVNTLNLACGDGLQTTSVVCMQEAWKTVSDKRCDGIPKPANTRPCNIPCPEDCEMTSYTEWLPCPTVCEKEGIIENSQMRQHYVLKEPKYEGKACPTALQEYRMCNVPCFYYVWDFSDWSVCTLPPNSICGQGLTTRSVYCKRSDGQMVNADFCVKFSSPSIPNTAQECSVTCVNNCVLNEWSAWSECPDDCMGFQIRTRNLLDGSQFIEQCRKKHNLEESIKCPCYEFHLQSIGDWSDCILPVFNTNTNDNEVHIWGKNPCGIGMKYRAVACYNEHQHAVELVQCHHTDYQEEICIIACPLDCAMGPWSNWTQCSASCGPGMTMRFRDRLTAPSDGGKECPTLNEHDQETEIKPCYHSCSEYKWMADTWGRCKSVNKMKCGKGFQTRKVRCIHTLKSTSSMEVSPSHCDESLRPINISECQLPCPGDCVVSPWTEWTDCNQPCNSADSRERHRTIMRMPDFAHDSCPQTNQSELCILGKNCYTYSWSFTGWSSCLLPTSAICGKGQKIRHLLCVRNDGRSVSLDFCDKENAVRPNPTESTCDVLCSVDCQLSNWSPWETEQCLCGIQGLMTRRRTVIQNVLGLGRKCQDPIVQFKPCVFKPCYHWKRTDWTNCQLQGAVCGHGIRTRIVTCVSETGQLVNQQRCLQINQTDNKPHPPWWEHMLDIQDTELCNIPCPGDCQLSLWSEWSHCHRKCKRGQQVGYQTRSRAVMAPPALHGESCPQQLWQTRPCFGGPCLTFEWYTEGDLITCRRKDGLKVTGGCHGKPRPCFPSCTVKNSLCSAGACLCQPGYRAVLGHDKTLHACQRDMFVMSNGTDLSSGSTEIPVCYYPPDGLNFWMFAVVLAGLSFVAFVGFSIYTMSRNNTQGRAKLSESWSLRRFVSQPGDTEEMSKSPSHATSDIEAA